MHQLPAGLTTDDGLLDRQARNKEQLRCLLDAVAVDGGISVHEGVWYEHPTTLSTGAVTPIALAFGTLMTFAQMRELSRHAYVAGIEPAFGEATLTGDGIDSPKACPRPECPERECAELDQWLAYREQQGRVAQVCIRSFIESIGGSTSEQASLDGGSITCMLTWAQIEQVAAHPDVVSITSNFTPT